MKSDLHIHPLGDTYSDNIEIDDFTKVVLNDEDKRRIRAVVDWCCYERKLDAIALTDHDMIQASLYAKEYAEREGIPIKIITGAECTVCNTSSEAQAGKDEVHLLCLGINALPAYKVRRTSVPKMICAVHELGGFVIMSHPVDYPWSFRDYWPLLDGYEYCNGHRLPFNEGKQTVGNCVPPFAFCNSDFHYRGGVLPVENLEGLNTNYYEVDILRG